MLETPLDDGLTETQVTKLFSKLSGLKGIPIEIQAEYSTAMGFIDLTTAEKLNYNYAEIDEFVMNILNDMNLEKEDNTYKMNGINIYLSRTI